MAKELSRTFDRARGAVVLEIEDDYGVGSSHTIYVARVADVDARIAQLLTDTDVQAAVVHERMIAAGWKP